MYLFCMLCSTRIQHNNQSVFISEEDVSVIKNFDGCDGAAIAELLATDEVCRALPSIFRKHA